MANLNENVKYLDLTGLTQYDTLIKEVIAAGDTAVEGKLNAAIGEGGNVATQIAALKSELMGTTEEGDSLTVGAINDELDTLASGLDTLANGNDTTQGSVANKIKTAIDAIGTGTAQGTTGKAITSITQTNGVVTATAGNIDAANVNVDWTPAQQGDDPVSATANVQAALNEIYGKIGDTAEAGTVEVYQGATKVNEIKADGQTYTIKQGSNSVATINIAADMVVSSGSVVTADGSETDVPTGVSLVSGEKYVRLVIANSTDGKNIYIPVNSLYKDHTAAANAQKIQIAIDSNNVISASVVSGSIEETDLTTALQTKINSAATTATAKTTGHVTLTFTPASGSTPANISIAEDDIASAQALSNEVTRAQTAEGEIAGKIGLTGNEGARVYNTNVTLDANVSKNVVNDINKLNSRLGNVETFITNLTAITSNEIAGLFTVNSNSGD